MPRVAAFVTIRDANFTIPDPEAQLPVNDIHFQFGLPGFTPAPGVLSFRLSPLEPSTFSFRINNAPPLVHNVDTSPSRSFHEIYPASTLREDDNELTMFVGEGRVVFSDVVFFYQVEV
jgi:hypothetical protein